MEDVKEKHSQKIVAEKIKEEKKRKETVIIKEISKKQKSDWRKDLYEGMTTGAVFATTISPAEGDGTVNTVSPIDASSFQSSDLFLGAGEFENNLAPSQNATTIRSSGSGSGNTGGFDVGGDYLAFQGTQGSSGARWAILKPMDATKIDNLTITAIRGTGSNGGEHPDVVGTEELYVRYKTPDMSISNYLNKDPNGNDVGSFPWCR